VTEDEDIERPWFHPSPMPAQIQVVGIEDPYAVREATILVNGIETSAVFAFHSAAPHDIELLSARYVELRPYLGSLRDAIVAYHAGQGVLPVELAAGPVVPKPTFRGAPQVEDVVIERIIREGGGIFRAELLVDGQPSAVVLRFDEEAENYALVQRDPRLDYQEGALVDWYVERYRAGHQFEFPFRPKPRFLLFEEGTPIRSVVLKGVEDFPGASVLRLTFAGEPGCYAHVRQGETTRDLASSDRAAGSRYEDALFHLVKRHQAGERLKFPIILRARNWNTPEVIEPE
jgi:hypothetical protein